MGDQQEEITTEIAPEQMEGGEVPPEGETAEEKPAEQIKYPIAVPFIIMYEFSDRFVFYGIRVILVLYFETTLKYTENDATARFHVWNGFCYFLPIIGAIISDSCLGKFKTIFYFVICYFVGCLLLVIANIPDLHLSIEATTIASLVFLAIGSGCVKPCTPAFGGDHFVMPQQEKQLQQYFSIFYFAVNAGSVCSKIITPFLKEDVQCFGSDTCYSLAFGVPAVAMLVGLLIFVAGFHFYKILPPGGNILVRVLHCIYHALVRKRQLKDFEPRDHWLEYADDMFDGKMIADVKSVMGIMYMLLPLPVYWALFDQQGSRWVFQGNHMNGYVNEYLSIPPDSMQLVNPVTVLILIPIFEKFIYPAFAKIHMLKKSLQRISAGGLIAALSFFVAMILEFQLQKTYAVLPGAGEAQVRIFNGLNRTVELQNWFVSDSKIEIDALDYKKYTLHVGDGRNPRASFDIVQPYGGINKSCEETVMGMPEKKAVSFLLTVKDKMPVIAGSTFTEDHVEKSNRGSPLVRIIYNLEKGIDNKGEIIIKTKKKTVKYDVSKGINATEYKEVKVRGHTKCDVFLPGLSESIGKFKLEFGGVYILVVQNTNYEALHARLYTVTEPNEIHMVWLVPQYFVITVSEIMFSITGLEFCFTQAPKSMKTVMQAAWLLTTAIGNYLAAIVAKVNFFKGNQAYEFMFFGTLMLGFMLLFMLMATTYKYVDTPGMEAAAAQGEGSAIEDVKSLSRASAQ